ncbi:hypothetical protein HS1genome_0483 [Sulfodiicoccus acidiphilus]|uniref:PIN domain-containing protein n=1 Tax=Sulfodiicoccus acidiphilus TaxID=1670455 RepID=A0A348B1P2_9CREN|nr:DNA-binding protein [Sulfodiicoccus acidiphilus]BBD72094.1 hypothetical protein HS1genome_0483 [Sulfodiicoccus acidiphilus]GGU05110.1 hypothetical protein GCM10007116_22050 [Sulfodiicoccus acidiphilus]
MTERVVFDTSPFIAGLANLFPRVYTTPLVLREVRDATSVHLLELAVASGKVVITSPSERSLSTVRVKSKSLGEFTLSETDVSVAALAVELKPTVTFTDDYSLQNLLKAMGLPFRSIRTTGITETRKFVYVCEDCGAPHRSWRANCERCGGKVRKVKI